LRGGWRTKALRTLLGVPASNPKMVEEALASEMDWLGRARMYRINALDTPHFQRDIIEAVEEAGGVWMPS
jgi:citrate lyase beta subunit